MSDNNGLKSALNSITQGNQSPDLSLKSRLIGDPSIFEKVVSTRRSVRVFNGQPIAPDIVHKILDLAMLAPSSSNLQPWEFHWVRSAEKRKQLVTACLSQPAAKTAGELIVIVCRTNTWRRNIQEMLRQFNIRKSNVPPAVIQYYTKLMPAALTTGPLNVIAPFKWFFTRIARYLRPTPQEPIGRGDVRIWAHKSVALSAQTLMLAARAYDLDTCPMEGFDSWRVRNLLDLPRDAEISMVVGLGVAQASGIYGERLRFNRDMFVFEH